MDCLGHKLRNNLNPAIKLCCIFRPTVRSFSTEYQALGFLGITICPVEMISIKTKYAIFTQIILFVQTLSINFSQSKLQTLKSTKVRGFPSIPGIKKYNIKGKA